MPQFWPSIKRLVDILEALVIKKDGSVAFTGNQPMGDHKITGLKDPTANQDAATMKYAKNIDTLVDALSSKRFQLFDLTTYDVFETYVSGSGSIHQGFAIAYVRTLTTAGSCSRQNLNEQMTQFNSNYLSVRLYLGYVTGNTLAFVGMIYGVKLTETQNSSTLTTKHVGIFYEDGQWYASVANGTNQTKVAITISGHTTLKMDFRTTGHAKFYNGDTLLADITTNFSIKYGYFQWFVHNKALAGDCRLYFYNLIHRDYV